MTPPPSPSRSPSRASVNLNGGFGGGGGGERINKLVAKRKPKGAASRRVQPTFLGSLGGAGASNAAAVPSASLDTPPLPPPGSSSRKAPSGLGGQYPHVAGGLVGPGMGMGMGMERSPFAPEFSSMPSKRVSEGYGGRDEEYGDYGMDLDVPISSINNPDNIGSGSSKRKAGEVADERPGKARTLGGDRVREAIVVRRIEGLGGEGGGGGSGAVVVSQGLGQRVFEVPSVVTYLSVKAEGAGDDLFEGKNAESGGVLFFFSVVCLIFTDLMVLEW